MSSADRNQLLTRLYGEQNVPETLTDEMYRTRDIAELFHVSERTVVEWARLGRLPCVRTPGGHLHFPATKIRQLLEASPERSG